MELENVKLENLEKGENIDIKLKHLNWINPRFSGLPSEEIRLLKKTINLSIIILEKLQNLIKKIKNLNIT